MKCRNASCGYKVLTVYSAAYNSTKQGNRIYVTRRRRIKRIKKIKRMRNKARGKKMQNRQDFLAEQKERVRNKQEQLLMG